MDQPHRSIDSIQNALIAQASDSNYDSRYAAKLGDKIPSLAEMSEISAISYARIHGYTYRSLYYGLEETIGLVSSAQWIKVYSILDIMRSDHFQHEWILMMDSDVLFRVLGIV